MGNVTNILYTVVRGSDIGSVSENNADDECYDGCDRTIL